MSKFSAWAQVVGPNGMPTTKDNGIRLQTLSARDGQARNYIGFHIPSLMTYPCLAVAESSHAPKPDSDKQYLIDGDPDKARTSTEISGPDSGEWCALWFGFQNVTRLILTPRRQNAKALCFPENIEIQYAEYPNGVGNPG